ncbi:CCA tRNA nucleotidyltransferase [Atopobium fossor]|uniref:CCA tRNA nucleotidyltransferase n=1 Tax=Atopobium fossor TaxID=39487 RepID=UPI0004269BEF|nr:HD domain-containing protein [Atopobium fossor]
MSHYILPASLPAYALAVLSTLEKGGYEAWVVGGWVRDALLGMPSHDVDVCTNAPWQESVRLLKAADIEVHCTGIQHGTVTAVLEGHPVEVTTYRVESGYSDLRHPDSVQFVDSIFDDLARRDLTINAMAYHPIRGLLDPYAGEKDLTLRLIRAVGDPYRRFSEDALRVLRAVRFAARLGFEVEPATQTALQQCAPELAHIARERIGHELTGIIATGHLAWAMRTQRCVLLAALPSLAPMVGFEQNSPYHCYDVYEHTMQVVAATECFAGGHASMRLRWASLLHDIGKPHTFTMDEKGQGHFFGHPSAGAQMSESILRMLALPTSLITPCLDLVRFHDRPVKATRHSVLRMMSDLDSRCPGQAVPLAFETLILKRADAMGKAAPYRSYAIEIDKIELILRELVGQQAPYRVKDLAISGADVVEVLGGRPGPWIGTILESVLREVVHGRLDNSKSAQVAWILGEKSV